MITISTDRNAALARLNALLQPDSEPVLTSTEVDDLLDRHLTVPTWTASTPFAAGDMVIPTSTPLLVYAALIDGGETSTTEPTWPTGYGSGVDWVCDGGQTWRLVLAPPASIYDVRQAAAEGWEMKAAKVSGEFDEKAGSMSGMRSQKYEHCIAQAKRCRRSKVA